MGGFPNHETLACIRKRTVGNNAKQMKKRYTDKIKLTVAKIVTATAI